MFDIVICIFILLIGLCVMFLFIMFVFDIIGLIEFIDENLVLFEG